MSGQAIGAAIVIAAVLGAVGWVLWGSRALNRVLAEHRTDEALRRAGMEAVADATREASGCGCRVVPCRDHGGGRMWAVRDGEAL